MTQVLERPASTAPRIAVVYDRLRPKKRCLFDAFERQESPSTSSTRRSSCATSAPSRKLPRHDVVLERCVSQTRGLAVSRIFSALGAPRPERARGHRGVRRQARHERGARPRGGPDAAVPASPSTPSRRSGSRRASAIRSSSSPPSGRGGGWSRSSTTRTRSRPSWSIRDARRSAAQGLLPARVRPEARTRHPRLCGR
jgi:hypothetical protein